MAQLEKSRFGQPSAIERAGEYPRSSPLSLMRRLSDDMDQLLSGFFGSALSPWESPFFGGLRGSYWPEIEVFERGNKLVVKADVPGLTKNDVSVEVRDGELCISGERRSEEEKTEGKYYRRERSYGSFCRTVPLPEGAKTETASANFENGVLEVEIEVPALEQSRGKRIEIREGAKPSVKH